MFFLTLLEISAIERMPNPEHVDRTCGLAFRKKCIGFSTKAGDLLSELPNYSGYGYAVLEEISPGVEQTPAIESWYIRNLANKWVEQPNGPKLNKSFLGFNSFAME